MRELKRVLRIPIAVKLSPFFTAFGNVAQQLDTAGADGLVLFNRFYQPDIDIRTISAPRIELSSSAELLLRLRWVAILHGRVRPSLAVRVGCRRRKTASRRSSPVGTSFKWCRHCCGMVRRTWRHAPRARAVDGVESALRPRPDARTLEPAHTRERAAFERANYIRTFRTVYVAVLTDSAEGVSQPVPRLLLKACRRRRQLREVSAVNR